MVEEFRELALKEFNLPLTERQALDTATRLIQIHYLLAYANRDLSSVKQEVPEPPAHSAEPSTTKKEKRKHRSGKVSMKVVPHRHENESLSDEPPIPTIWCNGPFTNA